MVGGHCGGMSLSGRHDWAPGPRGALAMQRPRRAAQSVVRWPIIRSPIPFPVRPHSSEDSSPSKLTHQKGVVAPGAVPHADVWPCVDRPRVAQLRADRGPGRGVGRVVEERARVDDGVGAQEGQAGLRRKGGGGQGRGAVHESNAGVARGRPRAMGRAQSSRRQQCLRLLMVMARLCLVSAWLQQK